jgi:hypothetical protein
MKMREAVKRYFEENGFGADGGYAASFVDLKLGPLVVHLPNTEGRKRAVRIHDLHHVVTGYRTDLAGEFEISGWELGGNCRGFAAAWVLNLLGLLGGMFVCPGRTLRAFVRGLRSSTLYHLEYEPLLDREVDDVRAETGLASQSGAARLGEALKFGGMLVLAVALALVMIPLVLNPLTALAWFLSYRAWKVAENTGVRV